MTLAKNSVDRISCDNRSGMGMKEKEGGNLTKRLLLFAILFFGGLFLRHIAQIKINLMFMFVDKAFFPPISYMRNLCWKTSRA